MFLENTDSRLFAMVALSTTSVWGYPHRVALPWQVHISNAHKDKWIQPECQINNPNMQYYTREQYPHDLWTANSGKPDYN